MRGPRKPSRPFGEPRTPFDPRTGAFIPLADQGVIRALTLVEEGYDVLVCEDGESTRYLVAKPADLRRSNYDGETIGGVTFAHVSLGERTASNGVDDDETHLITPSYFAGDTILVVRLHEKDRVLAQVWDELADYGASDEYVLDWLAIGREWCVE